MKMTPKPRHERILDVLKKLWALQHRGGYSHETHVTPEGWVYRADTQCYVETLQYDFTTREGVLKMGDDSCADMMGCVRLFQSIDPEVTLISTFNKSGPDTRYAYEGNSWKAWQAYSRRKGDM
jgi:hypothetical protein